MPLRPPEFKIDDPEAPFERDLLDRKPRIEALTRVIIDEDGPAVISVNGGFGSGKSAFLTMLAANLRLQEGTEVLEFNAWQQSHTADPLVDVVSALTSGRDDREGLLKAVGKFGWRIVKGVGTSAVSTATGGWVDLSSVEGVRDGKGEGHLPAWAHAESAVAEFTDGLRAVVQTGADDEAGPVKLVVIVDELDRCRPDYAIDMLNVVRHLFAVPGVVVVLGVNQEELEHRVVEVFGPKTKADIYLRRFVDLPVDLGPLDEVTLDEFSSHTLTSAGLSGHQHSGSLKAVLELMGTETGASLRDVQQTVRRVAFIVDSPSVPDTARHDPTTLEMAIGALLLLRHLVRPTYEAFIASRCDALAAVDALRGELQVAQDASTKQVRNTLEQVEAMLLRMSNQQGYSMIETPGFEELYVNAGLGDEPKAQQARSAAYQFPEYRIRPLADLIELVA